ncbi:MAG TPA: rhodanese-like domain-containing protein [Terracidiphilus sp.]|nr:rhodanese-like domain-containing protein [Terracidiphilus sp.]
MSWTLYFIALAVLLGFIVMRRAGQVPMKKAKELIRQGGMIIDVRTATEYVTGHLSQAVNVPVDEIDMVIPGRVKDRTRIMLLHCQSGLRSRTAKEKLEKQGYTQVYNLGSYERAFKIVTGRSL